MSEAWTFIMDVAESEGVGYEARKKWRSRGVPHKWRLTLLERARGRGVSVDQLLLAFDDPPNANSNDAAEGAAA